VEYKWKAKDKDKARVDLWFSKDLTSFTWYDSRTQASGSAASPSPKPRTPWMSCGVMASSCGIQGTVKERIDRVSRLATVAGPPSGTVGKRLSTPSDCSMMTLRWVTPSKRNRPIAPNRV
jgi:hypothetical protein